MKDEDKTKAQLSEELASLRQRISTLEVAESERQRAEGALKTQAQVLENMQEGVQMAREKDGIIFFTNPAFDAMFGYERGELIGQYVSILNLGPPQEAARIASEIMEQLRTKGAWFGELSNHKKDGTPFPTYARVSALEIGGEQYWVTVQEDISERKQAEQALRESEMKFRSVTQSAIDAIVSADSSGNIISWNKGAQTIFGYGEEEVLDKPLTLLMPEQYKDAHEKGLQRMRSGGEPRVIGKAVELHGLRMDGSEFPLELSLASWQAGKETFYGGIIRDLTVKKELEQQRTDFVAMLTHDIKNPLGVILGCTDLLYEQAREQGSAEAEDLLLRLGTNALTVLSLVTNYLDFSKIEAGHMTLLKQSLEINPILKRVGQQYESETQSRRLTLEFCLQEELPEIEADPLALERVFANLVNNAIKFAPRKGRVTLSSGQQTGEVVVAVADNGPGLAPEEIPSLFERYRRGKKTGSREGSGLGLYIVKALVEAHGGRVEVESTLGQGSCFSVFLPAPASS